MPNTVNSYIETDLGNVSPNPRGEYNAKYDYDSQFLHAYKLIFNIKDGELGYLNEKEFIAPLSKKEKYILDDLGLKFL